MKEFFNHMTTLEQSFWVIALIGSVIFVFIFIMTFIGGDMDADMEADISELDVDDGGVGFQFFTFKNVVAFFTIFGWTGIICLSNNVSTGLTFLISTIAGLIMMVLTSLLFFWMHSLAESGTLKIKNAVGTIGEVYLPIGANRSKVGKVSIKVQGSLRELEALTDDENDLPTGTVVKVKEIISAELLLVKKLTT
jgi:membrane protein implicated in regulation of membrane protease activity